MWRIYMWVCKAHYAYSVGARLGHVNKFVLEQRIENIYISRLFCFYWIYNLKICVDTHFFPDRRWNCRRSLPNTIHTNTHRCKRENDGYVAGGIFFYLFFFWGRRQTQLLKKKREKKKKQIKFVSCTVNTSICTIGDLYEKEINNADVEAIIN